MKIPLHAGRRMNGGSEAGIVGPSSRTGCIDRNVAAEPRGAELFAFRFSGCLDKQNSLFLLRPEGAEPQG